MTLSPFVFQFLTAGIHPQENIRQLRKLLMFGSVLSLIILILSFFSIYHIATGAVFNAAINLITLAVCLQAMFLYQAKKAVEMAINLAIACIALHLLLLAWGEQNSEFSLVWTYFLPIFAIFLKGCKKGLYILLAYYALLLPMAFIGINDWQHGQWTTTSFIRFTMAHFVFTYLAYFNERAIVQSYSLLDKSRDDEIKLMQRQMEVLAYDLARKQQLLTQVSHELRTPVQSLTMQFELLSEGILANPQTAYDKINQQLLSFNSLISDLCQATERDRQTFCHDKITLCVGELLIESQQVMQQELNQKSISVSFDFKAEKICIDADEQTLRLVFLQLLQNSILYTDQGGQICISAAYVDSAVQIVFQDSAPGVPEKDINKLFDALYRVDDSRSRQTGGAGLGLTICKNIIEAHNGHIYAQPAKMGGLAVVITLPLS